MKNHLVKLFKYNKWRHDKIYDFFCQLEKPQQFLFQNFQCLFFNTPAATDELWKLRLLKETQAPQYLQLSSYWAPQNKSKFTYHSKKQDWLKHYQEDSHKSVNNFINIINQYLNDQSLLTKLQYPDSSGNLKQRVLQDVFTHLINHHTHHIGQISAAYKQFSKKENFPSLDYTYFFH